MSFVRTHGFPPVLTITRRNGSISSSAGTASISHEKDPPICTAVVANTATATGETSDTTAIGVDVSLPQRFLLWPDQPKLLRRLVRPRASDPTSHIDEIRAQVPVPPRLAARLASSTAAAHVTDDVLAVCVSWAVREAAVKAAHGAAQRAHRTIAPPVVGNVQVRRCRWLPTRHCRWRSVGSDHVRVAAAARVQCIESTRDIPDGRDVALDCAGFVYVLDWVTDAGTPRARRFPCVVAVVATAWPSSP